MANQNNSIRPPVLPQNPNPVQLSIDDLTALISRISTEILRNQGPQVVQAVINPNVDPRDAVDQVIDDRHRDNLNDLDKIPDVVKCLKEFSGQPGEFSSWKKSVDRILAIYESIRGTPKYFGILSIIRNKITGNADIALESYNTPLNWAAISKCLIAHYGDKRDVSTLEHQMSTLVQGNKTVSEFYQDVYTHLSLILNKIGCLETSTESLILLTKSYREKALDTFIRGLNGDLPRLLGMKEPVDLPQALHLCLKLENQSYRSSHSHVKKYQTPQLPPRKNFHPNQRRSFDPQLAYMPQTYQQGWQPRYQTFPHNSYNPPRPPKPQPRPEPMDVDQSLRSRHINYMNRPHQNQNNFPGKRPSSVQNQQRKNQRTFHIDTKSNPTDEDPSEPTDVYFLA